MMNYESVDRQGSTMMDSDSVDRHGVECGNNPKMNLFLQNVKISRKSLNFIRKSGFHEK